MSDTTNIELSLLEGLDERLLERLHREGIRTREELGERLATHEARRTLADALGVSLRRLEILHHLNFLLPEDRADQLLDLQRGTGHRVAELSRAIRFVSAVSVLAGLLAASGLYVAIANRKPGHEERLAAVEGELRDTRAVLDAIRPLAAGEAQERLFAALSGLGPAPGWHGPLRWTPGDHEMLVTAMGEEGEARVKALSMALARLVAIENADTLSFDARARRMAGFALDFPPPTPANPLDWAAVALRERFRSRALGRAGEESLPEDIGAFPWRWTSSAFVVAEALDTRLDLLNVDESRFEEWSATVAQIGRAARVGEDDLRERPESMAGTYWARLADLKLGVVGALLGRPDLLPYHKMSPVNFLVDRRDAVRAALESAPASARAPLAWLAVEYEEAVLLAVWLRSREALRTVVAGKPYADALVLVETERRREGVAPSADLEAAVRVALAAAGAPESENPFSASRTRWEAGLRLLLMETRARV
jgi:hypothetical protein